MKLRYYLRGLGTGIVVTVLILIIASGDKESLSDAEIRERAAQLGMVESSALTLADIQGNQSQESQVSTEHQETLEPQAQGTSEPQESQAVEETENVQQPTTEQTATDEPTDEEQTSEGQTKAVLITVESGASSYTVSKLLEAAGLVEDAGDFDTYLCNNGYSRSIRAGKHEIPGNATWEEMAKIISGKQ